MRRPVSLQAPHVGSTLVPGVTTTAVDRERVLAQIRTGFDQLEGDVLAAAGWRPDRPAADEEGPVWRWWSEEGLPVLRQWREFYAAQTASWWTLASTDWDTYASWQDRLIRLRQEARTRLARVGRRLTSPDPEDVPRTPWDQAREVTGDVRDAVRATGYVAAAAGALLVLGGLIRRSR